MPTMDALRLQGTAHGPEVARDIRRLGSVILRWPGLDVGCYAEQMDQPRHVTLYRLMAMFVLGYVSRDRASDCDDDYFLGKTWLWYLNGRGEAWAGGHEEGR